MGQKNVLFDILELKKRLSRLKKQQVQKVKKIKIFPKELIHGFSPKMAIFQLFFFGIISQQSVFYNILRRKTVFLGDKNKKFKKSKN